jgi:hypothetical protein
MKKKLYVGCALTYLPKGAESFPDMVAELRKELGKNFEVMEFWNAIHPSAGTPLDVYTHDIKNSVMKADCMLAICDHPSLGLGYELATAVEKQGIPVLAMAHKDARVSRLILGINHPNFTFAYYSSVQDIIAKAREILTN